MERTMWCTHCNGTDQIFAPEIDGVIIKICQTCGVETMIKGIIPVDDRFRIIVWPTIYGHGEYTPQYCSRNDGLWRPIVNYWHASPYNAHRVGAALQVIEAFRPGLGSDAWLEWCKRPFNPWQE